MQLVVFFTQFPTGLYPNYTLIITRGYIMCFLGLLNFPITKNCISQATIVCTNLIVIWHDRYFNGRFFKQKCFHCNTVTVYLLCKSFFLVIIIISIMLIMWVGGQRCCEHIHGKLPEMHPTDDVKIHIINGQSPADPCYIGKMLTLLTACFYSAK